MAEPTEPGKQRRRAQPVEQDPESASRWQSMPQTAPSKDALPPAAGGLRWLGVLLILLLIVVIVGVLALLVRPA
jgi:hypothetical protein